MVRKIIGWVLLGLGAFMLALAAMGAFWAPGAVKKVPLDTVSVVNLAGDAEKLNPATGKSEFFKVKTQNVTEIDKGKSDDEVASWVTKTCVVKVEGETPDCVPGKDPRLVQASIDIAASDRNTGMTVNDPKYFGKDPVPHEGLLNKWPFDAEKKSYQLWDSTLKGALTFEYVRTEDRDGLETYVYEGHLPETPIEVADGVQGDYKLDKTVWIEPVTGALVDMEMHDVRHLEDGTLALDLKQSFTDETVAKGIEDGKANADGIVLVTERLPLIGLIAGLVLGVIGALLVFTGFRSTARRREQTAAMAPGNAKPEPL